ncbi:MAG: hypothetical protein A3D35_03035 [Candidatus Staskawiczbacteria bacterium RIFCSPHIGHO2_02_FULL_34_9]|uniref:Phosphatidylglycerol lysyltransferase C-terminal domain-containing protein n=1 Tax=Candidatus Staskawiczbacteria bacterium RIFCSPHIGHO2_02_FULL_34_9 TaxID=1802206 RepID=A0A1G2I475_9BACT|nr:MAG: hypothetical protein A3D35_03035 [Candidatus Staskawiczbacteria bacterium RIFCSPHIGHO2_02_FULL_34_9]
MKVISDAKILKDKIGKSISKYGNSAQHNLELFLNYGMKGEECIFLDAENQKGVMAYRKGGAWKIFTDPLCKEHEKIDIITKAIELILKEEEAKKIIMEDISEELRKKIVEFSKDRKFRVLKPSYSLFWPVIDLKDFSEEMPGKKWKTFRKVRNNFFRENEVVFKGVKEVDKKEIKDLFERWKRNRRDNDRVHFVQYLKFTDNSFEGLDLFRAMEVNGQIRSIYGGWKIPNSKSYYSFLGIHDYTIKDLGEVSYLDELAVAKKMGIELLDLGGIEKEHLGFKMKFHPSKMYRTDTFSIMSK